RIPRPFGPEPIRADGLELLRIALSRPCCRLEQMRRIAALSICYTLMVAYFLAPFQHVHADHDHAAVVHTHVYAQFHTHRASHESQWDDVDDHASVQSLDTFTLAFAPQIAPLALPRGPVVDPVSITQPEPVIVVEERA